MIAVQFPRASLSPTGSARVGIRYTIERDPETGQTFPVLTYARGERVLTLDVWRTWAAAGARITASTPRGRDIVSEALHTATHETPPDGR